MTNLELRSTVGELRSTGPLKISGYGAIFGAEYKTPGFTETIRAGAFSRALKEKQDVRCLFNHDPNKVLGRTASGTMHLEQDSKGLRFETQLPPCPLGEEVHAMVARGDVSGCSFSFTVDVDEWSENGARRELVSIGSLYDVGPVAFPAYEATSVSARQDQARQYRTVGICRSRGAIYVPRGPNLEQERLRLQLILARYK